MTIHHLTRHQLSALAEADMDAVMDGIKLFSVEQAERTLPLVRRVVDDIMLCVVRHKRLSRERVKLGYKPNSGSREEEDAFRIEREIAETEQDLQRYQGELKAIGVQLKDPELGLIDFYSRYGDQIIYLCWRRDEGDRIKYWHRLDGGYRGRQAITDALRGSFTGS